MAVRRELVYDERGGFAAADKLTPKRKQLKKIAKRRQNGTKLFLQKNLL